MTEDEEIELRYPRIGQPPPDYKRVASRASNPAAEPEPPLESETMAEGEMRHHSAARLVDQLDIVTGLAEHCERMTAIPSHDRIAPVYAAARLMNATAHVAKALGTLTHTEQRIRRIIEVVQLPAAQKPHSNSTLDDSTPPNLSQQELSKQAAAALDGLLFDTLQRKMLLYMNMVAAEALDPDLKQAYPEAFAPGGVLADAPKA